MQTFLNYKNMDGITYIKSNQSYWYKNSKGAKIRNRYNQVPHLTQGTNGKVTNSQLDTTNERQEVSPFSGSQRTVTSHMFTVTQEQSNTYTRTIKDLRTNIIINETKIYKNIEINASV